MNYILVTKTEMSSQNKGMALIPINRINYMFECMHPCDEGKQSKTVIDINGVDHYIYVLETIQEIRKQIDDIKYITNNI